VRLRLPHLSSLVLPSALVLACTAAPLLEKGGKEQEALGSGTGRLAVELVDAPTDEVREVVVTVARVVALGADGAEVQVSDAPVTVDLLTLQTRSLPLGDAVLPAGDVSELRLELAPEGPQYVTLADGSQAELKVPSGTTSGIKLPGPFHVPECGTRTLTVDFDAKKSIAVHAAGKTDRWVLRPVVFVKQQAEAPGTCDAGDAGAETGAPDAGAPDAGAPDAGVEPTLG
jgi:hypothetical protein